MLLAQKSKFDEYVKMGLLRSQIDKKLPLTVYVYTEKTQFDSLWNNTTLHARGIVFDNKGRVVQRALPKFFNYDEPDGKRNYALYRGKYEPYITSSQIKIYEKLDGSLIKITQDPEYGLVITSKASFDSVQVGMAKEIIKEKPLPQLLSGYTYHFELIHPDNQIVLNYGKRKELVLLAVVNNEDGSELDIYSEQFKHFTLPKAYDAKMFTCEQLAKMEGLIEGFVINYGPFRLKWKTQEYLDLHRVISDLTPKRIWEALYNNTKIDRQTIPEEFIEFVEETEKDLITRFNTIKEEILNQYEQVKHLTDKELGLSNTKHKNFIFMLRNNKEYEHKIWKLIKPKG